MGCNYNILLFILIFPLLECSNHWIVTENGKIRPQEGSPFRLSQSHDIMALIQQEQRISQLHALHSKLIHYQNQFVELLDTYEYLTSLSLPQIAPPSDCQKKEIFYIEPTTIPFEDKNISHHDYLDPAPSEPSRQPYCTHYTKEIPFSMYSMYHLNAMQEKEQLASTNEILLIVPFYLQLSEFGNSVSQGLERNTTSWVLYSLAALYWRAQGSADQAIDCILRSLYYAPSKHHDIPLLHLTNVFFTSGRLNEALIPLKVALSFSPSKGPLFYTLALIYKELGYLSDSVASLNKALQYNYHYKNTLGLRNTLYCQLISQGLPQSVMDRIIDTKNQLKSFCRVIEEVVRNTKGPHPLQYSNLMNLLADTNRHYIKTHSHTTSETHSHSAKTHSYTSETHSNSAKAHSHTTKTRSNSAKAHSNSAKTRSHIADIKILLACAIGDISFLELGYCNSSSHFIIEKELARLKARQRTATANKRPKIQLICETCNNKINEIITCKHVHSIFYPRPTCSAQNNSKNDTSQIISSNNKNKKPSRYTEAYRSMEFIPYSSLPFSLESLIFHNKLSSADYHDPYWPNKGQCLEVVERLNDNLPRFTGTFLTPEIHGIKFKDLLTRTPLSWQQLPHCGNVTSLPFSMASLDHLVGVTNRAELITGEGVSEGALKQLFITTIGDATITAHGEHHITDIESAATYITSALYSFPTNWALYNLASVYWRAVGNGLESVECLRRGLHYAPLEYRDVGLIGLANVLHRHGYLDSAMVTGRAALDIKPDSPIGHYTLAGIYLTRGDLMATNLHLRLALHLQPHFSHAYSALKLVRCSLKFKEEQKLLEQKQQLLLAQQELIKSGRERTSENLQEILQEIIKQRQTKEQRETRNLETDEVIKYLKQISIIINKDEILKPSSTLSSSSLSSPTPSSSPSLSLSPTKRTPRSSKKPKYTMELMAKENEREEALRKQWPKNLPWPTLEDCRSNPPPQYVVFTSTWLSVTAKKINISHYMDFSESIDEYSLLPFCDLNFEPSSITLNYLKGMENPPLLDYIAERGLEEVLCKLSGSTHTMEEMATRMKLAMIKNDSNWVVSNLAALYWRIVGDGVQSIKCLKHALHHAPPHNRDVAYVSIANVLYRSGYYEDAATSMQLALETSPNLVVNHFTMANILAAQSFYREAAGYYELVLYHQPEFGPASERLRASRCMIILGKNKIKLKDLHENK